VFPLPTCRELREGGQQDLRHLDPEVVVDRSRLLAIARSAPADAALLYGERHGADYRELGDYRGEPAAGACCRALRKVEGLEVE